MPLAGEVLAGDMYLKLSSDGSTFDVTGVMNNFQATFNFPTIDVSSQASGGFQRIKPGKRKSMSGTGSGFMRFTDVSGELNTDDIFTLALDGTEIDFKFEPNGTPGTGDLTYSGKALISNIQIGGNDDGAATYSFQLDSSDAFAKAVGA